MANRRPSPPRVLCAHPDPSILAATFLFLDGWGCEAHGVRTGEAVLAAARESPPDAVVFELDLPDMTGETLARALRSDPATADALLVAFGRALPNELTRCRTARIDRLLAPPVAPGALRSVVAAAARRRGARRLLTA